MSSIPSTLRFHSNGGTYPPHGNITPYDHGAYVVVTAWIFMCFTVLSLLARLGTRRALSKDNVVITVAAVSYLSDHYSPPIAPEIMLMLWISKVISILQSVTVHIAVNYGLGRHRTNIRDTHYVTYSKVYAICIRFHRTFSPGSLGKIRRSNTRDYCLVPSEDLFNDGFYEFNTIKASTAGTSPLHNRVHPVGCCSSICTCIPMSEAESLGPYAKQMHE